MALVIEDGTIVAGANSYVSIAGAKDYATARGVDLGVDDAITEQRLHNAMAYLESLSYKGRPSYPDDQALAWPRYGVTYDYRTIDYDVIPLQLTNAQSQLVIEQFNGVALWASYGASDGTEKFVKKEKVDVLETEYATPKEMGEIAQVASMPLVASLLRPLLRPMMTLKAYRG